MVDMHMPQSHDSDMPFTHDLHIETKDLRVEWVHWEKGAPSEVKAATDCMP